MKEYLNKYFTLRKHNAVVAWKKMKLSKMCYLFLAPYAILFTAFYILPVATSILIFWSRQDLLVSTTTWD